MAHEKVYGFCENKCKVPVAPKTETDAVAAKVDVLEPLSVIQVDENQNVTFPAKVNCSGGSFTDLIVQKTITVSDSGFTFGNAGGLYLPYVLGVTYSGTIKVYSNDRRTTTFRCYLQDGSITTISGSSDTNLTIPDGTVMIYVSVGGTNNWTCAVSVPKLSF